MNWDQVKEHWNEVCDRIKVKWGKLSEDDLAEAAGNRNHLVGLLQNRYGHARADAESKVDAFARELRPTDRG